jgi:uncharacterized glyoxalase superfamily protein PhnB
MAMTDTRTANPQLLGGIVPHILVSDASAASQFYQRAFGAVEVGRMPAEDGKRLMHCHVQFNGGSLAFMDASLDPAHGQRPAGFDIILPVKDIDAWWDRAIAAGAKPITPVQKMFWGDRYGQFEDPFGIRWSLDEPA